MAEETRAGAAAIWRLPAMRQLMALTFFGFTSFFITLSALPSWAVLGGVRVGIAGTVTTAMLVCTVMVQMLVPAAVRRLGTSAVLIGGLVFLGAPSPFYLLSQDLWWLLVVSALRGVGFAVLTVLGATLTVGIAPSHRRGEAIGLYGLAIAVPNLVAVPAGVGLTLAGHFPWVAVIGAAPLLGVPFALPLGRGADDERREARSGKAPRREILGIVVPSVLLLVVTLAGGGLLTFLPIERPEGTVAVVVLAVFGITAALSRWGAGMVADQAGTRVLLPVVLFGCVVGMLGVAFGLSVLEGPASGVVVGVAGFVLGAGYGATQNLTLLEAFARTERHGLASAVWNVCFDSGTALGAFAVGVVAAAGLGIPGAYVACALLIAATLPLVLLLRVRPLPRRG